MAYAFSLALEMSSMLNRASDCAAVVLKEVQAGVAVCAFALDVEKKRGGTSDCLNNILEWTEDSIGSGLIDQTTIPKRSACDDKSEYLKAQFLRMLSMAALASRSSVRHRKEVPSSRL
jgi:hypothetical protein